MPPVRVSGGQGAFVAKNLGVSFQPGAHGRPLCRPEDFPKLARGGPALAVGRTALLAPLVRWASRRRFPVLFGLMLLLLAVDLFVPDPIPLVDEALLAIGALLVGRLRKRDVPEEAEPPEARARAAASNPRKDDRDAR